jgi:DNA-binding LytR/AlgR family response regulator
VGDRARRVAARAAEKASPRPAPSPADLPAAAPAFLAALPPRLGRDLLCLQMEDHYLRVHTALGSDLVLTPLKDALAELTGVEGLQVHRSWWVARAAVAGSVSEGRNLRLKLVNGLAVPVARASVARLRASGWLEG